MDRLGVVLHPTRPVQEPLETLERWAAMRGLELVHLQGGDSRAPMPMPGSGEAGAFDLVVAIGGDGTVLTALRAAASTGTPVMGVACGSLGALSTVSAAELQAGLDRFAAGDLVPRRLPALAVRTPDGRVVHALNDAVLIRRGAGQLIVAVSVGDDLYARSAGDGVVVATSLGSSAYSMAAGGPLLVAGTEAFVCTPLAMHGGSAPPLVVPAEAEVTLDVDPGHGGFDFEVDGHRVESTAKRFAVRTEADYATLVGLGEPDSGIPGLRRRGLISDSPRVLARDARKKVRTGPPEVGEGRAGPHNL
jgi:NAD+ kinase